MMIGRAGRWLESSRDALKGERYDDTVYCAQMCSELAAKAVIALLGIEYPKVHDVSDVLEEVEAKLPAWFREKLDEIRSILMDLSKHRWEAGYGFEKGLDASHFADIAPKALRQAEFVFESCRRFVEGFRAERR